MVHTGSISIKLNRINNEKAIIKLTGACDIFEVKNQRETSHIRTGLNRLVKMENDRSEEFFSSSPKDNNNMIHNISNRILVLFIFTLHLSLVYL